MEKKRKSSDTKPFGQKLTSMRKKKKISIEELSEKTGLSIAHLNRKSRRERDSPRWAIC